MAPLGTAAAPSPDPGADPEGRVWGQARGLTGDPGLGLALELGPGCAAGQGCPSGSGQGWDGKGGAGAGPGGIPRGR